MNLQDLIRRTPLTTNEFNQKLSGNFDKWLKGNFGDRNFEVYPGIYQNSDEFREFRFRLFKELQPIAEEVNSHEFSTATQLLGEMGQGCSHVLLPFDDASSLRRDFRLTEPSPNDYEMLEKLIDMIIDKASLSSISVKDKSSSGYPFFIKGVGYKLSVAGFVFKKVDKIMELCRRKDLIGLEKEIGSLPYYSHGVRYQLDAMEHKNGITRVVKERKWYDPEYIRSNGDKGLSGTMDYSVLNSGGSLDLRFQAARVRSMYALNYHYNCILQVINNYLVNGLKIVAPEIVFSTPADAVRELGGFTKHEFFAIDYGNYGETIPGEVVNILANKLDKKMPGLGNFIKLTYAAPRIIRGFKRNVNDPFIMEVGRPFDGITSGLCSGNGLVAFLGKLCAVWDACIVFRKMLGQNFKLEMHLNNKYAGYKRKTSSDDGIAKFYDEGIEREYLQNISQLSIFKTTITDKPEFLGSLYLRDYVTRDIGKLCGHLTNFERGMRSKMFFELGIGCSISEYENNRFFSKVYPVLIKHFRTIRVDLESYRRQAGNLANPTAIFLSNPDSIFYKLDPKLVNAEIYKKFFANISKEFIEHNFKGLT